MKKSSPKDPNCWDFDTLLEEIRARMRGVTDEGLQSKWVSIEEEVRALMRNLPDEDLQSECASIENALAGADTRARQTLCFAQEFVEEEKARRLGKPYEQPYKRRATDGQLALLRAVLELSQEGVLPTILNLAGKLGCSREQAELLVDSCIEEGLLRRPS